MKIQLNLANFVIASPGFLLSLPSSGKTFQEKSIAGSKQFSIEFQPIIQRRVTTRSPLFPMSLLFLRSLLFFVSFFFVSNIFKIFFTARFVIMESKTRAMPGPVYFSRIILFRTVFIVCEGIFHVSSGITYFILHGRIVKGERKNYDPLHGLSPTPGEIISDKEL